MLNPPASSVGSVTLVGAGPGDPELITVKGLAAIRAADVLVYDRLVSPALLEEAKAGCECIDVGKASGNHTLPQEEINRLLVSKAQAGARVVRLKGGDPFVFGRGGEEMAFLVANGIPCSVVPGVTSAIAAAESVGIPVTHRGVSTGFEVVTAHGCGGQALSEADFHRLADGRRTVVFLMGLARIADLAASLVAAGRAAATPAAVIGSATTADSRCIVGTLADIAVLTEESGIDSPAVLVVGEVVAVRHALGFGG